MKTFFRLNILSALYGLLFGFFHIVYVYQATLVAISPLGKTLTSSILFGGFTIFFILSTFLFFHLTGKWFQGSIRYVTALLWLPYFLLSNYIVSSTILPQISPQYEPAPGGGFVIMSLMLIYPFLIGMINGLAHERKL